MKLGRFSISELRQECRKHFGVPLLLTVLTLLMMGMFHSTVFDDRLILNLYYIVIASVAYALVQRRALSMMAFLVSVAGATTMINLYSNRQGAKDYDTLLDPVIDLVSWGVLMILCWRLALHSFRFNEEQRRIKVQREIQEKTIATRAAALTCTSHEVRTPLAAILAVTETLLDESPGDLNEMQKDFLQDIDSCAKHLMSLVNDILDYAKIQSGRINLTLETVSIDELINQCLIISRPIAEEKNVEIATRLDPSVNELIADPLRLKQILLNLISNGVKHSPDGGLVKVDVRAEGDKTIFGVRDTGHGISQEEINNLFEPYYQAAHGSLGIGTGLGLAITKELVELHGGTIAVESVIGSGSLFVIELSAKRVLESKAAMREDTWIDITSFDVSEAEELVAV